MKRTLFTMALFCVLVTWAPLSIFGQAEAQSTEDVLEFQNLQKPNRTFLLRPNDHVKIPFLEKKGLPPIKGTVTAVSDSSLEVRNQKTGEEWTVDVGKSERIHLIYKKRRAWGWPFFALALLSHIPYSIGLIALLGVSGFLPIFAFVILSLFINPYFWLGMGIAILLWGLGRRQIHLKKWKWRKKRIVTVRKKAGK